jgi:hypothetical protein
MDKNNTPTPEAVLNATASVNGSSKKNLVFALSQEAGDMMEKADSSYEKYDNSESLMFAIKNATGTASKKKAPALAFTENPVPSDNYLGLYKSKRKLLPDEVLKMIRVQDHLVAAILRARGNMMSLFGHLRKDRFDIGLEVKIIEAYEKLMNPDQLDQVTKRIKRLEQILLNCGHTDGLEEHQKMTFADYLDVSTRNGLTFGRFSTEIIYDLSGTPDADGNYPFHRFRPTDTGTIVKAVRKGEEAGNGIRLQAIALLQSIKGEKVDIDLERLLQDEYAWLQVIEGVPRQAFTHKEMLVFNLFESTDIEHNGYPVSPIDTCVSSVTTHISIDTYKKLYFQNGRASKGMLVIQSDEVDQATLESIKLQFNAAINNVSNSFRTPIFGMGKDDQVQWVSTNEGAQDSDFQFMYDQVARNILSAFSISPDELPGYAHLSRGTNSQTLSESNNEFKLTAARDTGLRPLVEKFQTFLNQRLLPIIDPILAKIVEIRLAGLDAQSKEQESTRLQQDMPTHMTYDQVLKEVDKDPIGDAFGGSFPFNERWQLIADKMMNLSELKSRFFGDPSAIVDPMLQYKRDPFFLQYLQLMAQANPSALQAWFAPKPHAMEFLKMEIQDLLEGDDDV